MAPPMARLPADWSADGATLAGRVVLVTGANGGLGRATALACAVAGARVVLSARKVRPLEQVYDAIVAAGGPEPAICPLDLASASPAQHDELADAVGTAFGRLDGIVHAAAHFAGLTPLMMEDAEEWLLDLQVNITAPLWLTRACLPLLQAAPDSAVVFVLDHPERTARAHWGGYGVAKGALQRVLAILHDEHDEGPLRIHGLLPAPMRTALRRMAWFGEDTMKVPTPEASAAAAVYLLGAAGATVRGQVLDLRPPHADAGAGAGPPGASA
ncbi:MAG TPA: SDR family NAD(P)-dependent oxidoreductase [Rhodanobacteraceae bacterium]|nr:SDR family NAD(P)-dependent oxidoreductase [Rhodanobacteraceae bacterium]